MQASDLPRAVAAATSIATGQGLTVDHAVVLNDSNKLALRLLPCDVVARVAHRGQEVARFEVELAQRLAELGSPVAALDPRVEPRPYEDDGFVVTLWTHHEPVGPGEHAPSAFADALARLHADLRTLDVPAPHHTDRVSEAQRLVAGHEPPSELTEADRALIGETLRRMRRAIGDRHPPEQLLHGEPHPGNLLSTADGLRFIDLETVCHGPVELDLAYVPDAVSRLYPDVDRELLGECRALGLAMVAAWRWDPADRLPGGRRALHELLAALREGPPWPTLDDVWRRAGLS